MMSSSRIDPPFTMATSTPPPSRSKAACYQIGQPARLISDRGLASVQWFTNDRDPSLQIETSRAKRVECERHPFPHDLLHVGSSFDALIDDLEARRDGRACVGASERQRHHSRGPDVRISLDDRRKIRAPSQQPVLVLMPTEHDIDARQLGNQFLIVLEREMRQRDHRRRLSPSTRRAARAPRREEQSTVPTDVWLRASSGRSIPGEPPDSRP